LNGLKLTTSVIAATVSHLRAMAVFFWYMWHTQTGSGNLPNLLIICE